MTVYDVFLVNDERDLMQLRIDALSDVVDHFVAVLGNRTFQGAPKAPEMFGIVGPAYHVHAYVVDLPEDGSPWDREAAQRNGMTQALAHLKPPDDAVILLSDVDELPRPEAIPRTLDYGETGRIGMRHTMLYADLEQVTYRPWYGTRCIRWDHLAETTPQQLRGFGIGHTWQPGDGYEDGSGGVHLSFLGGVEAIQRKLRAWAHAEANRPRYLDPAWLARCLEEGIDWHRERDLELRWVEPDGAWPQPLLDHPEQYPQWFGRKLVRA